MNLSAKNVKQLLVLAVALFFFSCEDDTSIIGYKNPQQKFRVQHVEIPVESSVILMDSTVTDVADGSGFVLAGEYFDPYMGNIAAQPFIQVSTNSATKLHETAIYDSITVQFRLNFYAYGFTGRRSFSYSVHELTDTLSLYKKRYYSTSSVNYASEAIGQVGITVDYEDLDTLSLSGGQDTLLLEGKLANTYGEHLFDLAKNNPDSVLHYFAKFKQQVKGLTLVPDQPQGVLGLNLASGLSQLIVHYHTLTTTGAVDDTLKRVFGFNQSFLINSSFTQILNERGGTELASALPYEGFDPAQRYIQSGNRVMTKLDFSNFYNFADTVENIVINSAELIIDDVNDVDGVLPHSALALRLMNADDRFIRSSSQADSTELVKYYVSKESNNNAQVYHVVADRSNSPFDPAVVGYDRDDNKYSGFITLFAQSLFKNKNDDNGINENRVKLLGLYSISPEMNRSVTRTVFPKNNIKLRINYTRATDLNP